MLDKRALRISIEWFRHEKKIIRFHDDKSSLERRGTFESRNLLPFLISLLTLEMSFIPYYSDSQFLSILSKMMMTGSKETSFAHSLAAAGVVHAIARGCRDGQLSNCGCSRSPRPKNMQNDWIWGGCGDNIEYGYRFAENFIDVREKESSTGTSLRDQARKLMNLHNNEAGRRVSTVSFFLLRFFTKVGIILVSGQWIFASRQTSGTSRRNYRNKLPVVFRLCFLQPRENQMPITLHFSFFFREKKVSFLEMVMMSMLLLVHEITKCTTCTLLLFVVLLSFRFVPQRRKKLQKEEGKSCAPGLPSRLRCIVQIFNRF
jgi:hypothetical protein